MLVPSPPISHPETVTSFEGKPLLFRPDSCSVSAALTHLKGYRDIPLNVAQAVASLQQFEGPRPFNRLYRAYFPLEWACSTESLRSNEHRSEERRVGKECI